MVKKIPGKLAMHLPFLRKPEVLHGSQTPPKAIQAFEVHLEISLTKAIALF